MTVQLAELRDFLYYKEATFNQPIKFDLVEPEMQTLCSHTPINFHLVEP